MRSWKYRILLPLTWLVAAPLLGWGGYARAGFDTAVALVGRPHADSFTGDRGSQAASAEMESGESNSDVDLHRQDAKDLLQALYAPSSAGVYFGPSSTGAGGVPGSSSGSVTGGFNPLPTVASRPATDAPTLAGFLFLQAAARQPPPFPSRLFRPPRLS